jgi:hypothetical protein
VLIGATKDQWDAEGRLTNERGIGLLDELMADLRRAAEARREG